MYFHQLSLYEALGDAYEQLTTHLAIIKVGFK